MVLRIEDFSIFLGINNPKEHLPMIRWMFLSGIMLAACTQEPRPHHLEISDDKVEVIFGRDMSVALLDSVRAAVAAKGVSLSYPSYDYDGELLTQLEILVQHEGQVGQAKTHFIYKGRPFGFRINFRDDAKVSLEIGDLSDGFP